jgi:hypothetical protein
VAVVLMVSVVRIAWVVVVTVRADPPLWWAARRGAEPEQRSFTVDGGSGVRATASSEHGSAA